MVAATSLDPALATVERLVDFLEQDGFALDAAVWTQDEAERWRLYLVPSDRSQSGLRSTIRVAHTVSKHADDLPDREDLLYSVVGPDDPLIQAIRGLRLGRVRGLRKVGGVYGNDRYIDRAYVLRLH